MKYYDFLNKFEKFPLGDTIQSNEFIDCFENNKSFGNYFSKKIEKLYNIYNEDKNKFEIIFNKLKSLISDKNWKGMYAEILAYAILNDNCFPINIDNKIDNELTFALEYGDKCADLDGYFEDFGIYFDVKILQDNEFLDNVIKKAKAETTNIDKISILPEYDIDNDMDNYDKEFKKLVEELKNGLDNKLEKINSNIIGCLSYNIKYGSAINYSTNSYNPYKHAENFQDTLLKRYYKKFVKDKPFFLVIVNSWLYNSININCFDTNKVFYRSLARRVFMRYKHSDKKMKEISKRFQGEHTVFEVSKKLSGIIFIDDLKDNNDNNEIKYYVYTNPNASNKSDIFNDIYLRQISVVVYDDFLYDNY